MRLAYPADAVLVVAGVPGAGKTTLIRRTIDRGVATVIDTDDRRARGTNLPKKLLYLDHWRRVVAALEGERPVVVHTRGTNRVLRVAIARYATARGRGAYLILLDADREAAEAGQRARGRYVSSESMDRHMARWRSLREQGAASALAREGWREARVLDRAAAREVQEIVFETGAR